MGGAGPTTKPSRTAGMNHPGGVNWYYYLDPSLVNDTIQGQLVVTDAAGDTIRSWATDDEENPLKLKGGSNRLHWDLRYPGATKVPGMILWWAGLSGPRALPGQYRATLTYGAQSSATDFTVLPDGRSEARPEDLQAQFDFMLAVRDKVSEAHGAIIELRKLRSRVKDFNDNLREQGDYRSSNPEIEDETGTQAIVAQGDSIIAHLTAVEEALYQTKNRSRQDPLNFPIRLTNKLAHLNSIAGIGDYRPTEQLYAVRAELTAAIDEQLREYRRVISEELPQYNQLVRAARVDAVAIPKSEK